MFAVLVDPDKMDDNSIRNTASMCNHSKVDFIFAGGSLMISNNMEEMIKLLKTETNIPVIIFPGNSLQISKSADAILLLSLISGRNADMLIGKHVEAAPIIRNSNLEIIPTGYILVESGSLTTALYMSNSTPVPYRKPDVAACTALAGEMLGLKTIYLDAGSGASKPVPKDMIKAVKDNIEIPLIVGGGIKSAQECRDACKAGADIIVAGNAVESNLSIIRTFADIVHEEL